jgi:hypothetical protein
MEARLPINLQIPSLKLAQHFITDKEALQGRIDQLMELEETRRMDFDQMVKNQDKVKGTFDLQSKTKRIQERIFGSYVGQKKRETYNASKV